MFLAAILVVFSPASTAFRFSPDSPRVHVFLDLRGLDGSLQTAVGVLRKRGQAQSLRDFGAKVGPFAFQRDKCSGVLGKRSA